jgi:hypothetical protein
MRTFTCYRPSPPPEYYKTGAANAPDQPQFQGVIFDDGTVVLRWMTDFKSHSVWQDWTSMHMIHGHPEYGTYFHFDDELDEPALELG